VLPLWFRGPECQPAINIDAGVVLVGWYWKLQRSSHVIIHKSCQGYATIWPHILPHVRRYAISKKTIIIRSNTLTSKDIDILHAGSCHHFMTITTTKRTVLHPVPLVPSIPFTIWKLGIIGLCCPRYFILPHIIAYASLTLRAQTAIYIQPKTCEALIILNCFHRCGCMTIPRKWKSNWLPSCGACAGISLHILPLATFDIIPPHFICDDLHA